MELSTNLSSRSTMIGYLCTSHWNNVHFSNLRLDPASRARLQSELDDAAVFIHVIYIYSLLDEAGFRPDNEWLLESENAEFKAWVHIRHTGAHMPNGRAQRYYREFDDFMLSGSVGISRLAVNCQWDTNSIKLERSMSLNFYEFASGLVLKAMARCENNRTSGIDWKERLVRRPTN